MDYSGTKGNLKPPGKISSVVLWSVISAAFIGPGTVTTAVTAGSSYGLALLWAVTFATLGCIVLQEISARIAIATGESFGQLLIKKFGLRYGRILQWAIGGSVILGCAAYEAGNILGGVSGMMLMTGLDSKLLTILLTLVAGIVLWAGGSKWLSSLMTLLVAIMGLAFAYLAFFQLPSFRQLLSASVIPSIPLGSELIVLGLVGTTIVPYNIFIGSGISKGQTIPLMRIGLIISILIGGLITAAILIGGIGVGKFDSFEVLAKSLTDQVGAWGGIALGLGLFAAGFSSAITSPFAAAVITSSVFGMEEKNKVRMVWGSVLLTGFVFGISGVKPIPIILAVQALNGLILPLITAYLIIMVNDHKIMPKHCQHAPWYNVILLLILGIVLLISFNNIDKVIASLFQSPTHLTLNLIVSLILTGWVGVNLVNSRK